MTIQHVITTLRYTNIAFLTGKISKKEASFVLLEAMLEYKLWPRNDQVDILYKNLIEALND